MRRIESIQDDLNDVVTFDLGDGSRVAFEGEFVREFGIAGAFRAVGLTPPEERLPVHQAGRVVGTVPGDFDPNFIKSTNWLYEPRRGDFARGEDGWVAAPQLGPGDLDAVQGFVRQRDSD